MTNQTAVTKAVNQAVTQATESQEAETPIYIKGVPSFYIDENGRARSNFYISYGINNDLVWDDELEYEVDGPDYWLISKVAVKPEYRGRGIARQLMTEAIADMRAERPELEIMLVCDPQDSETDGEKLLEFYESFGFSLVDYGAPGQMVL